jgi:hypothetical protein
MVAFWVKHCKETRMFLACNCQWIVSHQTRYLPAGITLHLLSYIRNGPALRDVHLEGRGASEYMKYLIDAVAESPHVSNFKIAYELKYPPQSMSHLLTTNETLKRLDVLVVESKGVLPSALKSNQTIEHLSLMDELPEAEEVELVLSLYDHHSLQKLDLWLSYLSPQKAIVGALSIVLPSLLCLTDLSLTHHFRTEEMDLLCEGLHANQSIVSLRLSGDFVQLAAESFAAYMQTRNGVGTKCITFLSLFPMTAIDDDFVSCDFNRLVADLLNGPRGSGLRSFELTGLIESYGIWDVMAHNKTLVTLKVHVLRAAECSECIPKLTHLRELELVDYHSTKECKALCDALKKNTSLYDFSLTKRGDAAVSFEGWDAKVVRLIKTFGERNRHLPQLLTNLGGADSNSDPHSEANVHMSTTLPLAPTVLCVAKQTPRMTRDYMLKGLLALNDLVGPRVQAPLRTAPTQL